MHHSNLHSFPTRRSSDLKRMSEDKIARMAGNPERESFPAKPTEMTSLREIKAKLDMLNGLLVAVTEQNAALRETVMGVDRKSTRLNSSHVEISYAVFCLK